MYKTLTHKLRIKDLLSKFSVVTALCSSLLALAAPILRSASTDDFVFSEWIKTKENTSTSQIPFPYISMGDSGESYIAGIFGIVTSLIVTYSIYKRKEVKQVMLLYSHKDLDFAQSLRNDLNKENLNVLTDKDIIDIGDDISEAIKDTISKVDKIIVIASRNSQDSTSLKLEFNIAKKNRKPIFPVLKDEEGKVFAVNNLKGVLYADLSKDDHYKEEIDKLKTSLIK